MSRFLPYSHKWIDEDDVRAVTAVLKSDHLTGGSEIPAFEAALAAQVGAEEVVACANGTAALHLTMQGLSVKPGDWVIVPAVTFLSTANAVRLTGAEVIFADVDPLTGNMTPEALESILAHYPDRRIRGVVPVHMGGHPVDMRMIAGIAHRHGLFVVEDACHALGAHYETEAATWAPVGANALSDATVFSFHSAKSVTTGEGGAVSTNDAALAARLRTLRNHGIERQEDDPQPWRYQMTELAPNYRMTDMQAALGTSQLKKLQAFVGARERLACQYDRLLNDLAPEIRPCPVPARARSAWHLYRVLIDFSVLGLSRAAVMRRLAEAGIGTQVHYMPVAAQPYYEHRYGRPDLPGAFDYYHQVLSLPLYPGLEDGDVDRVVAGLRRVCDQELAIP